MTIDLAKLHKQLIRHEGLKLSAYQDSLGYWTIGTGRLIDARKGGGISENEADYLLSNDVVEVMGGLDKALPWWNDLDEVRQRVLADLCFNLGLAGLLKFRATLAAWEAGDYERAADGLKASKWYGQVKTRGPRLAQMLRTGQDVA